MANYSTVDLIAYDLKATLKLKDGTQIEIPEDDISTYSPNTTQSTECIPLGAAAATTYELAFNNQNYAVNAEDLDGAEVHVYVSEGTDAAAEWKDFGVWFVDGVASSEQDPICVISGSDALNSKFSAKWTDTKSDYPRTLLLIVQTMCAIAGVELATPGFKNAGYTVSKMPNWGEDATIRDVISHVAVCAAGFARINYSGALEIHTIGQSPKHTADADYYSSFAAGGKFSFNCLQYKFEADEGEEEEYTRFAINANLQDNATNTIQLSRNPLVTEAIANNIAQALNGVSYEGASIVWFGGTEVLPGDELTITTTDGASHRMILNTYSVTMNGGMSSNAVCDMPSVLSQTGYYSNGPSAFNPDGSINVNAIPGLDKKVVSAELGYFNSLTAETIKSSKLLSAIIQAATLRADNISSASVETDILTAMVASIVEATIKKLTVGTLKTDALSVAFAEIIGLKVGSLTASDIATDRLAAALAAFTVITAGTAEFDRATVGHLVSKALNLEFGTADEVFIKNLRVAYAQMVQATIGNLVIQAADGNYYQIDVNASGSVTATPVTVSEGEIEAGQTDAGRVILATNITADSLNTSNLLATYALINQIDAARIDVDQLFAREAFIARLMTTDISSNSFIQQSIVNTVTGEVEQFVRQDANGVHIGKQGAPESLLLADGAVNSLINGQMFSKFASNYAQFGKYQIRTTKDGGLIFKMEKR